MLLRPYGLRVLRVGPVYADLAWDGVPGAAGYLVELAATRQVIAKTAAPATTVTLGNLAPSSRYTLRVFAYSPQQGFSPPSQPLEVRTP